MAKKSNSLAARLSRYRAWFQATFLAVWLDPLLFRLHHVCGPVFHCHSCPLALFACPIGVMGNFAALSVFPFITVGMLLVVGVAVGTFICGWVCPFGFLQDLAARVPTPKFELPAWTGYTRYAVLVGLVLLVPFFLGKEHPLFFCSVCPAGALEASVPHMVTAGWAGESIPWPSTTKLVILAAFLGLIFFTWRPWCTLFCPLGAIYGLANKVSIVFLRFHPDRCNDCNLCRTMCHYTARGQRRADELRCIRCLECTRCQALTVSSDFVPAASLESKA